MQKEIDTINQLTQIQKNINKYLTLQFDSLNNIKIPQKLYQIQIGPHLRHCYNFGHNFLTQLKSGTIDYETRARNSDTSKLIETSQTKAIKHLKNQLTNLTSPNLEDKILQVTNDFGTTQSNTKNELTTIASHTMHHLGLIGEKLQNNKIILPKYFGYAPSTIEYLEK
jgi:uncharacterized damage-inducible protein DinB